MSYALNCVGILSVYHYIMNSFYSLIRKSIQEILLVLPNLNFKIAWLLYFVFHPFKWIPLYVIPLKSELYAQMYLIIHCERSAQGGVPGPSHQDMGPQVKYHPVAFSFYSERNMPLISFDE